MSLEHIQQQRNFEQNSLVWLNEDLKNEEEINNIKMRLRSVINYLRIFDDVDECIDYVSSSENEKSYLLITSPSANVTISLIDEIVQIERIYILNINNKYLSSSKQEFKKNRGIYSSLVILCDTMKKDIAAQTSTYNSSELTFSALPLSTDNRSDRQEASFMYFRLLTDTLLKIEHKKTTRDEFISLCRQQYDGNLTEMEKIEEFNRTYSKENAVCWYTRDSFLYRMLNNALRIQDIEILFQLGFFITDLYHELESLCSTQLKSMMLPSVVYRGQFMSTVELENKIQKNVGGFLSINSFFSTSANKRVALMFTNTSSSNELNTESVLFEITVDSGKCRRPIADIRNFSYMQEEDEILFSMGAVFRIESIVKSDSHTVWIVCLVMNGEEDEELNSVRASMNASFGLASVNSFAGILLQMGEYQKAEHFLLMLIRDTEIDDPDIIAGHYSNLSMLYNGQKNYDASIACCEKALHVPSISPSTMACIYINIGVSYIHKRNFTKALQYCHEVLNICEGDRRVFHPELVLTYENLSSIYLMQEDFAKALEYSVKATGILEDTLPANHPKLAHAYILTGTTYLSQAEYDLALVYLLKGHEIQKRTLPKNHPDLLDLYCNVALVHLGKSNEVEAHHFVEGALQLIDVLPYNSENSNFLLEVAGFYMRKDKLTEALHYLHKALDVEMKLPLSTNRILIDIYKSISMIYMIQENDTKVLNYCQKAIPIALKYNHENLAFFYSQISSVSLFRHDIEQAIHYHKLALDYGRAMLPPDDPCMIEIRLFETILSPYCTRL